MTEERPRPSAAALAALQADDWAALLAVALPVLRGLEPQAQDQAIRRVLAAPVSKLVSGRTHQDLVRVLVRPAVWPRVERALPDDAPRPWEEPPPPADPVAAQAAEDAATIRRLRVQHDELQQRAAELADRLAAARDERAELSRSLDGAEVRARTAEEARDAALEQLDHARTELAELQQRFDAAADEQRRAVARARRRDAAADRDRDEELAAARRTADELRAQLRAAERETDRRVAQAVAAAAAAPPTAAPTPDTGRGRRGRPSTLPEGVEPGTRRAAEWLVGEGRLLLVDGYNVTRTHRAELSFPEQRRWLEDAVAALTQRRHVDATIVWDASHGRPTTTRGRGRLSVRFTAPELSADDELVLHVETLVPPDAPTVVVTDDAELRGRLARYDVDLLDTLSFSWLL